MAPHLELCGLHDEVSKLLDDYVGDVKQMDLQGAGVQHSMEGHDDLGLLLHGQGHCSGAEWNIQTVIFAGLTLCDII